MRISGRIWGQWSGDILVLLNLGGPLKGVERLWVWHECHRECRSGVGGSHVTLPRPPAHPISKRELRPFPSCEISDVPLPVAKLSPPHSTATFELPLCNWNICHLPLSFFTEQKKLIGMLKGGFLTHLCKYRFTHENFLWSFHLHTQFWDCESSWGIVF